jgi:nucleoprotein TPR
MEETSDLAAQLARALQDRDVNDRRATGFRLDAEAAKRERDILTSQLGDLGRQVRALSRAVARFEDPSIASRSTEDDDDDVEMDDAQADVDAVIPLELITFATVSQLVQRNHTLLRVTRELSASMDVRDEDALRRRERSENEAIKEAHDTIVALKDELERQRTQMDASTREREMLRRLVSQRGSGGGALINGVNGHGSSSAGDRDESLARTLADVQVAFEAYKTEATLNAQRASEDVTQARREAAAAAVAQAKANAQLDFLNGAPDLDCEEGHLTSLQRGYGHSTIAKSRRTASWHSSPRTSPASGSLPPSKSSLSTRCAASANLQQLDQCVRQYSQKLIVARGSIDKLEHEISNLRAEREVWKGVEARLVATNETLSSERGQLNDLLRTLQSMQNELESSGSAARRRLEDDVAKLDSQLCGLALLLS